MSHFGSEGWRSCSLLTLWRDSFFRPQAWQGGKGLTGLLANSCPKKWSLLTLYQSMDRNSPGSVCPGNMFVSFLHRGTGSWGLLTFNCHLICQMINFCLSIGLHSVFRRSYETFYVVVCPPSPPLEPKRTGFWVPVLAMSPCFWSFTDP